MNVNIARVTLPSVCVYVCLSMGSHSEQDMMQAVVLPMSRVNMTSTATLQLSSYVGDRTFAVLLQRDLHVGCGNVSLLAALLTHPCPAVPFILFNNIQHLILLHHQRALI